MVFYCFYAFYDCMKQLKEFMRKAIAQKHLGKEMIWAITINVIRDHFSQKSLKSIRPLKSKVHKVEWDLMTLQTWWPDRPDRPDDFIDSETWFSDWGEIIDGYVKFNKIFIRTQDQWLKIEIFKQKKAILELVNQKLENVGYKTKMMEIYIK